MKRLLHHPTKLHFNVGGWCGECHEIEWRQRKLWYRRYMWQPSTELSPNPEAWERFWQAVEATGVWQWRNSYENSEVLDGTQWSLKLAHQGKRLTSGGSNAFPGCNQPEYAESCEFGRFIQAVRVLTGKNEIG
jgi:hypothetical protein